MHHASGSITGHDASITPWLTELLLQLLRWPGLEVESPLIPQVAVLDSFDMLETLLVERLRGQNAVFGRSSRVPVYRFPVQFPLRSESNLRVVVVQGLLPQTSHFADYGYMHFLAIDEDFREEQGGRLLQRLCESETYRIMALLAFPVARRLGSELDEIQAALQILMQGMNSRCAGDNDADLLVRLLNWRRAWNRSPNTVGVSVRHGHMSGSSLPASRNCGNSASKGCQWSQNSWSDALRQPWRRAKPSGYGMKRSRHAWRAPSTCYEPASILLRNRTSHDRLPDWTVHPGTSCTYSMLSKDCPLRRSLITCFHSPQPH